MTIKSFVFAAAVLALPAAVAAPAHASGMALPDSVAEVAAFDVANFGFTFGSRGAGNTSVLTGSRGKVGVAVGSRGQVGVSVGRMPEAKSRRRVVGTGRYYSY